MKKVRQKLYAPIIEEIKHPDDITWDEINEKIESGEWVEQGQSVPPDEEDSKPKPKFIP